MNRKGMGPEVGKKEKLEGVEELRGKDHIQERKENGTSTPLAILRAGNNPCLRMMID